MIGICERCFCKRVIRQLFYIDNNRFKPINLCHDCEKTANGFLMVKVTNKRRRTGKRLLVERVNGNYYYVGGTIHGKKVTGMT